MAEEWKRIRKGSKIKVLPGEPQPEVVIKGELLTLAHEYCADLLRLLLPFLIDIRSADQRSHGLDAGARWVGTETSCVTRLGLGREGQNQICKNVTCY
jgi:hypothetical protein